MNLDLQHLGLLLINAVILSFDVVKLVAVVA